MSDIQYNHSLKYSDPHRETTVDGLICATDSFSFVIFSSKSILCSSRKNSYEPVIHFLDRTRECWTVYTS